MDPFCAIPQCPSLGEHDKKLYGGPAVQRVAPQLLQSLHGIAKTCLMSTSVIAGIIMRDLARSQLDSRRVLCGAGFATNEICDPDIDTSTRPPYTTHIRLASRPFWPFREYVNFPSGFASFCVG